MSAVGKIKFVRKKSSSQATIFEASEKKLRNAKNFRLDEVL